MLCSQRARQKEVRVNQAQPGWYPDAADNADSAEETLKDFRNEVLDQSLRERIRNETAEVRNLILSLAFSNTGLASGE